MMDEDNYHLGIYGDILLMNPFFQNLRQITQLFTVIFPIVYIISRYFRTG